MLSVTMKFIMLNVIMMIVFYAGCHNEVHFVECHYAECRYAECRGAHGK